MSGLIGQAGTRSGTIPHGGIDYEEGVFSAELRGQGGRCTTPAIANDTSGKRANYIKIGNVVHVDIDFLVDDISGASGQLQVTGLPFDTNGHLANLSIGYTTLTHGGTWINLTVSGTTIWGQTNDTNGTTADWVPTYSGTKYFRCTGTYSIG